MKNLVKIMLVIIVFSNLLIAQNITEQFGKMYSFHNIPIERINKAYNVNLSDNWYNDVMKGALQLGYGCSASFVSADGLIMTNHHCVRDISLQVQKEGEDFLQNGFYAIELSEERKIPGLFVDQLLKIENITNIIITNYLNSLSDAEKKQTIQFKTDSIETYSSKISGLVCKVIPLYGGAKYVLHYYKRYNDVRLVMLPEFQIASTGWDWDNFTYPRYELDFAFLRAFENNNPVKINDFFKFSMNGAKENELTFVIGRPGNTDRLYTSYQLNYLKNFSISIRYDLLQKLYDVYFTKYTSGNSKNQNMLNNLMGVGNSKKAYEGMFNALNEKKLFELKTELENYVTKRIFEDAILGKKYGHVLEGLKLAFDEYSKIGNEFETLQNLRRSQVIYWDLPMKVVKYITQINLPDSLRDFKYKESELPKLKEEYLSINLSDSLQIKLFSAIIKYLFNNLTPKNNLFATDEVVDNYLNYLINNSFMVNKEKLALLLNDKSLELTNINDPLLRILSNYNNRINELSKKAEELNSTIENLNRLYNEMLFAVFGENISPDATSTLRITDGTIKGYEYNGTIAPAKTTYFGLYDRYYSFGEKNYPWGLPNNWIEKRDLIDFSTPLNFASTHDIVGGNSGSSVINTKKEVVGLIFDGNYESLSGFYYYNPLENRAVGVDSKGLLFALKNIYNTDRLTEELINGKR